MRASGAWNTTDTSLSPPRCRHVGHRDMARWRRWVVSWFRPNTFSPVLALSLMRTSPGLAKPTMIPFSAFFFLHSYYRFITLNTITISVPIRVPDLIIAISCGCVDHQILHRQERRCRNHLRYCSSFPALPSRLIEWSDKWVCWTRVGPLVIGSYRFVLNVVVSLLSRLP